MGKRKEAPGSGGKGKKPSNWSFWALGTVAVALLAWSSLRQEVHRPKPKAAEEDNESDEVFDAVRERFDDIREALFSEDGRANFGKDGNGAKRNGSRFSRADYWESRYSKSKQEHYDWYGTWNSQSKIRIKPHVLPWMPAEVHSILNVGCGNSRLAEELANDGYTDIVSVDIAQSAIDKMTDKFKGVSALRFQQMDATKMTFKDNSFDVVFDKGTLDAMYTGAAHLVKLAVPEVFRVLRPGGVFVSLTFGHPRSRKDLNRTSTKEDDPPGWEHYEMKKIHKEDDGMPDKQTFWMYLMTKPKITQ